MRLAALLWVIFIFSFNTFSKDTTSNQESEEHNEFDMKNDSIIFSYNVLEPEPKPTDFNVFGDTINFEVYYIDYECDEYLYEFERQDPVLIVRRIPKPSGKCDRSTDIVYAFEGRMLNVPPGRYQFQLESKYGESRSVIFREVINVK